MTLLLAIDPGTTESAFVRFDGKRLHDFGKIGNDKLLRDLMRASECSGPHAHITNVCIEMVQSFGMPVGREVFETVKWVGRFQQAWGLDAAYSELYRKQITANLCGSGKAKDANIRAALIDRFGGSRQAAVGVKAKPGPLYGVSADVWSALAIACTWFDLRAVAVSHGTEAA